MSCKHRISESGMAEVIAQLIEQQKYKVLTEYLIGAISTGCLTLEQQTEAYNVLGTAYLHLRDQQEADKAFRSAMECMLDRMNIPNEVLDLFSDMNIDWASAVESLSDIQLEKNLDQTKVGLHILATVKIY